MPRNVAPNYNQRIRQNQSRTRWLTTQSSVDSGNDENSSSTTTNCPRSKVWGYRPPFQPKIPHKPRRYFTVDDPHIDAFLKLKKRDNNSNDVLKKLENVSILDDDYNKIGGGTDDSNSNNDQSGYLGDDEEYDEMDTASGRVMECAICYRAFRPEKKPFGYTQCQHVVCVECMIKWICHPDSEGQTRDRCVVCRQKVKWTIITNRKVDEKMIENLCHSEKESRKLSIGNFFFVPEELEKEVEKLLKLTCPFGMGKYCSEEIYELPFRQEELEKFSNHVMNRHDRYICILCINEMKLFAKDIVYFHRHEFEKHLKGNQCKGIMVKHEMCPLCPEICFYFDNTRLLEHCRESHLECYICGGRKFFSDNSSLQEHLQTRHSYCASCRMAYGTHTELYNHTRAEHPNLVTSDSTYGDNIVMPAAHPELSHAVPTTRGTFDEIDSILRNKFRDEHDPTRTLAYDPNNTESYLINFPSIDGRGGGGLPPKKPSNKKFGAPLSRNTYDCNFPALAQKFINNGASTSSSSGPSIAKSLKSKNIVPINKKSVPDRPLTANHNNSNKTAQQRKPVPKYDDEDDFPGLKISSSNPLMSAGTSNAQEEWSRVSLISKPVSVTTANKAPKKPASFKNYEEAFPQLEGSTGGGDGNQFPWDIRSKKSQSSDDNSKTTGGRTLWSSTMPLDPVMASWKQSKPRGKKKKSIEERKFNGFKFHKLDDHQECESRISQLIREFLDKRPGPGPAISSVQHSLYETFEQLCYNYYQSIIPAIVLYESMEEFFGSTVLDELIWPFISTLPDIEKQNELYQIHMDKLKRLGNKPKRTPATPCNNCRQVVMIEDRDRHQCAT